MSMPSNNSLHNPNDNMTYWTQKYPSLLPKNMMGLSRMWDKEHPPFTFMIMPPQNSNYNFQWPVMVNPSAIAEEVEEGAESPLMDAEERIESFVCREFRLATKISQRLITHGIRNVVRSKTENLVDAVNKAREYLNLLALTGSNLNQSVDRLNVGKAGQVEDPTDDAKAWNEDGAKILDDVIAMKDLVEKYSGEPARYMFVPRAEYKALQKDSEIKDEIKYTRSDLLTSGEIPMIKGLQVIKVSNFFKNRKKTGEDARIELLTDKVLITTAKVGFTAVAEPMNGTAPIIDRWEEKKQRAVYMHAFSSFCPVIEDYSRIGVITDTNALI